MADRYLRLGSSIDIFGFDDALADEFGNFITDSAEFPTQIKVNGLPTDPLHVVTLANLETAIEAIMLSGPPPLPTALVKAINNPHTPVFVPALDDDGSWLALPTSETVGTITLYGADGVGVSSALPVTGINASADAWAGFFFLDETSRELWVWAYDTGTGPDTYYLAAINLDALTLSVKGTCTVGDDFHLEPCHVERAAAGSGNFTVTCRARRAVISATNGSVVTGPSTITQSGAPVTFTEYITADGLINVKTTLSDYTHGGIIGLQRGGAYAGITLPLTHALGGNIKLWGNYVGIYTVFTSSSWAQTGPRFFLRADFDQWLHDLADYLGLPT